MRTKNIQIYSLKPKAAFILVENSLASQPAIILPIDSAGLEFGDSTEGKQRNEVLINNSPRQLIVTLWFILLSR